ncbi:MAG: putative lipid II flippase FtsW [Deltaproteobacteria bacterium]|nr:putative lipid II flippase FtsW [Deltaproteobacteria bacterium]
MNLGKITARNNASATARSSSYDYIMLVVVMSLTALGIVLVFSASSILAEKRYGDAYFFLKRQASFALLGLIVMIIFKNTDYHVWRDRAPLFLGLSILCLVLVLAPHVGVKVGGAHRWIRIYGFSFQPSEMAKLAVVIFMARWVYHRGQEMRSFWKGFVPPIGIMIFFDGIILLQPDMGTAMVIGALVVLIMFVSGVRLIHLGMIAVVSIPMIIYLVVHASYRMERLLTFLNPWRDPSGRGFQIIHSFLAFGCGGVFGAGLGDGRQKLFYLPEPHTDFIFSVAGEEIGFLGVFFIIFLYFILIIRGMRLSLNSPDLFGTYLAFGLTSLLGVQVMVNMGVVLGLLPTKGMALPFLSYGGSSLLFCMAAVGILLNISTHVEEGETP